MLGKVKEFIKQNNLLFDKQNVIVGFSGGADSTVLLFALKKLGYSPIALHVNHQIRGQEALRDEEFAREFCKNHDIDFYVESVCVPQIAQEKSLSLETAARQERHRIFLEYSQKFSCPIAVAHNKNDQAETVLMHLMRGCGLNGICGIAPKNKHLIRPLLAVSRDEIESFAKENNLDFIIDSTNLVDDCARNKLRLNVLAPLFKDFPDALDNIFDSASLLSQYAEFIKAECDKLFIENSRFEDNKLYLKIGDFNKIQFAELIRRAFEVINGNTVDLERVHIDAVIALSESGKQLDLPFNTHVLRVYNELVFFSENNDFSFCEAFVPFKEYSFNGKTIFSASAKARVPQKNTEFFDLDKLPCGVCLRTRQSGDFIAPFGLDGTCTLKKYFIDKKIPITKRDTIPLLAKDNEVLLILGYTVSQKIKIDKNTKNILMIQEK